MLKTYKNWGNMLLRCCGKKVQLLESIALSDLEGKTNRVLVVGRCVNKACGALCAHYIFYDIKKCKFFYERIKKNKVKETIDKAKENPYVKELIENSKIGTKTNQNWVYGKTKIRKENGKEITEFYAVNFNGQITKL